MASFSNLGVQNNISPTASARTDGDISRFQVGFTGPDHVLPVIAGLGRTEDVKFSPSSTHIAVACFAKNSIAIFGVNLSRTALIINLTSAVEIFSSHIKSPHGVDFIDDNRIIVANRDGDVTVFHIPEQNGSYTLHPVGIVPSDGLVYSPGSLSVCNKNGDIFDVLICSNYGNKVTKHTIQLANGVECINRKLLLNKRLEFPDGISIITGQWMAVSDHGSRDVLLYDAAEFLNEHSDPVGLLRGIYRPHGVRFAADGELILVADYEGSYVHFFKKKDWGWRGVHTPSKSLKVSNDGIHSPIKGIDISGALNALVTTGQGQPLAFFDLDLIMSEIYSQEETDEEKAWRREYQLKYELVKEAETKRAIALLTNSRSWRITAPFRWAKSFINSLFETVQ